MLPAFRVRGVRPVEDPNSTRGKVAADGIIRMKREDYDDLLKREPEAALRYLDEDDGEIILVGSGFELDQRLMEPIGFDSNVSNSAPVAGEGPMHTFEVERQPSVVDTWKQLDFESQQSRGSASRASIVEGKRKMTFEYPDLVNRNKDIRFGQASPLSLNAPTWLPSASVDDEHVNRWSSYVALPSSFDQQPYRTSSSTLKNTEDLIECEQSSNTSALQTPANRALSFDEALTLLKEIRSGGNYSAEKEPNEHQNTKDASAHQPLLHFFEPEIQKLVRGSTQPSPSVSSTGVQAGNSAANTKNASTSTDPGNSTPSNSHINSLNNNSIDEPASSSSSSFSQEPFALAIRSLLAGVNLMVTGLTKSGQLSKSRLEAMWTESRRQIEDNLATSRGQGSIQDSEPLRSHIEHSANAISSKQQLIEEDQGSIMHCPSEIDASRVESQSDMSTVHPFKPSLVPVTKSWKVERIIGKRFIRYNTSTGPCVVQYLVRWVGCGPAEDMWYDEENLLDCREMIQQFEAEQIRNSMNLKDLNVSLESQRQHHVLEAQTAAELHIRTGGDRMVVWKERYHPNSSNIRDAKPVKDHKVTFADRPIAPPKSRHVGIDTERENLLEDIRTHRSPTAPGYGDSPITDQKSETKETSPALDPESELNRSEERRRDALAKVEALRRLGGRPISEEHKKWMLDRLRAKTTTAERTRDTSTVSERNSEADRPLPGPTQMYVDYGSRSDMAAERNRYESQQKKLQHRQSWHSEYQRPNGEENRFKFSPSAIMNSAPSYQAAPYRLSKLGAQVLARSEPDSKPGASATPRRAKSMTFNPGTNTSSSPPPLIDLWSVPNPDLAQRSATVNGRRTSSRRGILKNRYATDNSQSFRSSDARRPGFYDFSPASFGGSAQKEVAQCIDDMIGMGYTRLQAETVAMETSGDLIKAIDLLEEDRKAWEAELRGAANTPARVTEPLPGSWDEELYG